MRKAKATYYAPEGDNPVVEMRGQRFFDGQEVELNTDEHGDLIDKLKGNQHFDVEVGEEEKAEPRKRPERKKKSEKDVDKERVAYGKRVDEETGRSNQIVPDSSYQGGPFPGGRSTGVPGTSPDLPVEADDEHSEKVNEQNTV